MPDKMTFRDRGSTSKNVNGAADTRAIDPECATGLSTSPPYRFEINIFDLCRLIIRKRKPVLWISCSVTVLVAIYLFLQPNLYTSTATILPTGKTGEMSTLKSLMGSLGGQMPVANENSSALFPIILRSNLVTDEVLKKEYTFSHDSEIMTMNLVKYLGSDNPDRLRNNLRDITAVRSDKKTGEIYVGVETKYPAFSQAVLTEYLAQLENFNLHERRLSAKENERYLVRQVEKINEELKVAEDNLETFQKANLDWATSSSPEVLKELARMQREVDAKSSTYLMLLQQHEMAKLDAQKDIPIVSVLDPPSLPTMKSGPFRRNIILLTAVTAFLLVIFAVVAWDLIRQGSSGANRNDRDALEDYLKDTFPRTVKTFQKAKILT